MPMSNRLASASSPYLLQHARDPVDWYPWGDEALARARAEDKPIFLSIGYAACHWCHVMAHESFEDAETAALMNAHFISIKVDREERPDLDRVYMQAVVSLTGSGGWPLSVFLTPEAQPFFGGTYFPLEPRHGLPAFRDVLSRTAEAWRGRRAAVLTAGEELTRALQVLEQADQPSASLSAHALAAATEALIESHDSRHGGWGLAPKFPQPLAIEFLLQRAADAAQGRRALRTACHALTAMADGGIHDQIGGGFHRYAIDARWSVPHFEKMLYDSALLARAYLHAWQLTGEPYFRNVLDVTLNFLMREMRHRDGGFFASLDADSADGEGRFYVWTYDEASQVLQALPQRKFALAALGITPEGNFEGYTVLHRAGALDALAADHGLSAEDAHKALQAASDLLGARRAGRHRPAADDKIVAEWNGLVLVAFAEAARATGTADYFEAARGLAAFLSEHLVAGDRVHRTWRDGHVGPPGQLADHAALALGFLAQYQSDFELRWFDLAERILDTVLRRFAGPEGALYDTPSDQQALIVRPRSLEDNPTPSGNSLALLAVRQLAAYTGESHYRKRVEAFLRQAPAAAGLHPTAFAAWLASAEVALQPARQLALVGRIDDPLLHQLATVAWRRYDPRLVLAAGGGDRPALLASRSMLQGAPTAYFCTESTCQLPTSSPLMLARQLEASP
jgi:uncharacterized protein YyaL (SSP411 family)